MTSWLMAAASRGRFDADQLQRLAVILGAKRAGLLGFGGGALDVNGLRTGMAGHLLHFPTVTVQWSDEKNLMRFPNILPEDQGLGSNWRGGGGPCPTFSRFKSMRYSMAKNAVGMRAQPNPCTVTVILSP